MLILPFEDATQEFFAAEIVPRFIFCSPQMFLDCRLCTDSRVIHRNAEIAAVRLGIRRGKGPLFFQVKVNADALPLVLPPRDGAHLKHRFREALLGAQ